jgi:MFS family permease
MVAAALPPLLVGSLSSTMADDLGTSAAGIGALVSASYLAAAVLSPIGGRVVQRIGPAAALRLLCAVGTCGLVLLATASGRPVTLSALLLLGVPNALVQPASNGVLATVEARWRGLLFGAVQSAIPVATLLSGVLLAGFHDGDSWRVAFWLAAALTVAAQLCVRRGPAGRLDVVAASPAPGSPDRVAAEVRRMFVPSMVGIGFLGSAAATSLAVFGASGGVDVGLSTGHAAAAQMAGSGCCIAVRVFGAWYGGKQRGRRLLGLMALLFAAGAAGFAGLALPRGETFPLAMAVAYGCGWGWTGLFNLTVALAQPHRVAQVTGLTQMGLFLGSVIGPLAFARLVAAGGYAVAWPVCAVASAMAATGALLVTRTLRSERYSVGERTGDPEEIYRHDTCR